MKKLKIIVSPFYSEESFEDKVTGFKFYKTDSPYVISLDDERLVGIKEGLRKNFLIPYDKETLDYITSSKLILPEKKQNAPVEETKAVVKEDVKETAPVEEAVVAQEEPTKKARKQAPKKAKEAKTAE